MGKDVEEIHGALRGDIPHCHCSYPGAGVSLSTEHPWTPGLSWDLHPPCSLPPIYPHNPRPHSTLLGTPFTP